MSAPQQRFSTAERAKIARALRKDLQSREVIAFIKAIEDGLTRIRADLSSEGQYRRKFFESRGARAPRGRPNDGQSVMIMGLLYLCARLYTHITSNTIKNSRSHPFYRLAQVCLRRSDPSPFIARLKSPPWNDYNRHDGLADARTLILKAFAEGLKPDAGS